GTSTIVAEGGNSMSGWSSVTFVQATAASSTIMAIGATGVDGGAGTVNFEYGATAGNATLIAEGGTVRGGIGGRVRFWDTADGGTARAEINSGATFDISLLSNAGMSIGSIEGGGTFFLGSKTLTVGGNGADTTVPGVISDGGVNGGTGGSLIKSGAG